MTYRLIALDIDGTLIAPGAAHTAQPDAEMSAAIRALDAAGVVVVLASGRMYPGTASVAQHLGLEQPLICQQGASVHTSSGAITQRYSIDQQIAHELIEFARAGQYPFAWFDGQRYLVSEAHPAAQHFADVSGVTLELNSEPETSGVEATGIDIISTPEQAQDIHRTLEDRYGERVHFLDFPSVTAAHAPEASKGNAIALVAARLGIEREAVLAIGDSVNDVSMLRWAGHSAAPAHCDDYARGTADEILHGPAVTGVAELLRKVLPTASAIAGT